MKPSKFAGHAPRPTKGTLTTLATKQVNAKAEEKQEQVSNEELAAAGGQPPANEQPKAQEESTVGTAPQPKAEETPAPAAEPPKVVSKKGEPLLFRLGKKYAPKTDRNSATWGKLTKALAEGPKTLAELTEEIKDHKDFLGYMTRGGHIIPHVAEEPKVEVTA